MFKRKFFITCFLSLFTILGALSLTGCSRHDDNYQGYIEGTYTYIGSPVSGILDHLYVNRGVQVKKGEKLFQLNPEPEISELKVAQKNLVSAKENLANLQKGQRKTVIAAIKSQEAQVKSSLDLSQKTLYRLKKLFKQHLIDKASLDKATAEYNLYKEKLREIKANLREAELGARSNLIAAQKAVVDAAAANVRKTTWILNQKTKNAPLAAQVFDTLYTVGEVVPASAPVVALLPPNSIKVIFFLPERDLSKIKMGQKIFFTCDGCKDRYEAKVSFVSPEAEYTPPVIFSETSRDKLVYRIKARMSNELSAKMHPGQPVTVSFN